MRRRRRCTVSWFRNGHWASPGYGRRHVSKEKCGTRETRLGSPRRVETERIRREPKASGAKRESEGLVVPLKAVTSRRREGALLWSRRGRREARGHAREGERPGRQSARTATPALDVCQAEQDTALSRAV